MVKSLKTESRAGSACFSHSELKLCPPQEYFNDPLTRGKLQEDPLDFMERVEFIIMYHFLIHVVGQIFTEQCKQKSVNSMSLETCTV